VLCYFTAAVVNIPVIGLIACALTGFCTSMLWPGNLVVASAKFPQGGVFIYALMAAGGDLGASVAPQLVGIITDAVIASPAATALASSMSLAPEQLGMKLGMLVGMLFPLAAIPLFCKLKKSSNINQENKS
jgi:MFS family permease